MTSLGSKFYGVYGKMQSFAPRSKQRAASSGTSGPSAGPAGSSGGASGGPFVTFRVTAKGMQADETLYLVGDDDELGAWNPLQGKKLCKDGETWTIRRPLKRGMSLTYKFVSVSKDTGGKRDFFVRWENGDDRVFKKQSFGHGPPTYSFDLPEITGFGERQRVTLPVTQEPEPSRGTSQEKETTSAFEGTGAHDWLCQDDSLCEGQEQKDEKVNTFVSLESKVDDVIDGKPLQAESVDDNLRAQKWLRDSVPSRTQHVSQDQFSGLCQEVEVAEAFLPPEFTGTGKVETLEIDRGLQEKLLERIAKLETDAAVQAESVAHLQAKIEGLVQMEGNRYLKDTLCQKQQELEHAVNCVEKKIEHIPTTISDFETRFEQVESDVASQKDHLATLISHSGERFQHVERVMAHKNDCDALISDCHTWFEWFRMVENAHKNDLVALVSQFDIKFKEVESAMADKNDLVALISDSGAKFEKVESALASQKNDLATLTSGTRARFESVENALASQKSDFATLASGTRSRLEKVESAAASDKNDLVALISDSGTRVEKVESAVAAQKKDLAAIVSDSGAKFEKVERAMASDKNDLVALISDSVTRVEKVESAVAAQKKDLAAIVSDSGAKFEKVESALACQKTNLATLTSGTRSRLEKVESAMASDKNDLVALISDSGAKFEKVESALASQKNDLATLTSGTRARFESVENALASQKTDFATLASGTRSRLEKVESAAGSDKNDLVALISDSGTRFEKVESAVASHWADIASQKKTLSGLQRQINDLDLKIPEADDTPLRLDSEAQKEMQRMQQQLKDLESQVAALSESVQRMSENSTSASKLKLPSSIAAPPLHPTKVDLQPARSQPTVVQNEDLDEWNDVGLQRSDLEAKSMNVEQPQSNTRACSKPDDLKATGKSAFCGFQFPTKPEDEAIAKVCLEVEEKLHAAVRQNDPLDARKSLLRKVLLRLHSDKTGAPSAGMIWIEAWKNTHIEWYYNPHPVPEDQQKYMRK